VALFGYWFRYTCLMILRTKPAHDFARAAAEAYNLNFPDVTATLRDGARNFDVLQQRLDNDYAQVMRLLREANAAGDALETGMLKVHYAILHAASAVIRRVAPGKAAGALSHMSDTISHFAAVLGEQASVA